MKLTTKILIGLGVLTVLGLLIFIVVKQLEIAMKQQAIETQLVVEQKELADNIMRSQSTYATKDDIEKFIKDNGVNLKTIQDDLSKLHAQVDSVNVIAVNSQGQHASNLPSSSTGPSNPNPPATSDPYGYMKRQQNLDLHENFSGTNVPIGNVGFSAWQKEPWNVNILPREYHVTNVIGTDENKRTYVYNKFSVKEGDKTYDVKISSAQTEQVLPKAKFSFNPRLFIGVDGFVGVNPLAGEFTPSLSLQLLSWGQYKNQPEWSIAQVGIGYGTLTKEPQIVITPAAYNIGKHIPFIENTYVAPSIGIGIDGNVFFGAGIKIGL